MMSSPLRALVKILLLNATLHDDEPKGSGVGDLRTSMTPSYIGARAVDLQPASLPDVARDFDAMAAPAGDRLVFALAWRCRR